MHERVWRLPIAPEHAAALKNAFADTCSTGVPTPWYCHATTDAYAGADRWGGASKAAAFLQKFVADGVKWSHVDIAGPAMLSKVETRACMPYHLIHIHHAAARPLPARRHWVWCAAGDSVSAVSGLVVTRLTFRACGTYVVPNIISSNHSLHGVCFVKLPSLKCVMSYLGVLPVARSASTSPTTGASLNPTPTSHVHTCMHHHSHTVSAARARQHNVGVGGVAVKDKVLMLQ